MDVRQSKIIKGRYIAVYIFNLLPPLFPPVQKILSSLFSENKIFGYRISSPVEGRHAEGKREGRGKEGREGTRGGREKGGGEGEEEREKGSKGGGKE